jgi:hypothetical protein
MYIFKSYSSEWDGQSRRRIKEQVSVPLRVARDKVK